jgi:signal transduction histidine kinase
VSNLAPELRPLSGVPVTKLPPDPPGLNRITSGALYAVNGRVYYWVIIPVQAPAGRLGYVAEQRRVVVNPATMKTINGLLGSTGTVYLRNAGDRFWAALDGTPVAAPTRRDTTDSGFIEYHGDGAPQVGMEAHVKPLPYVFVLEVPRSNLVLEPRATLRSIALLSLVILIGGVITAWALARRITRPLGDLTVAAEAIARGDYRRRVDVPQAMSDEVDRLGTSFNRMASQVEGSQRELASQVNQALAVTEELEAANERLRDMTVDAEEARDAALTANRAKSDFLAVMSHELRTPLNAIGGYADIMKLGIYGDMNEAQNDALTRIARSQQTLLALINDVLNFAKLEAGEVSYAMTDVPLAPAIAALEDLVSPQLRDRRLRYEVETCAPELAVRADAEKLQQILINLLSNAIKYTPEGGQIAIHCDVDVRKVHINVTDSGIGIAEDRLARIFDPFIQVGRALNRPHEGVGLGLSISRDLARAMGGSLVVRSKPGEGSTFTLTLDKA